MVVHLIDGTYELYRHFYGLRRFNKGTDRPFGAVVGVLQTVLQMIDKGATHLGVASDHVIESFRNDLWPDYKTGEGIEPALFAQFEQLEQALAAMGVAVWPMIELEADDALASAAQNAAADERVEKVCIWTVDKDLAQCVRDDRVVQVDRRARKIFDRDGRAVRRRTRADSRPPGARRRRSGWIPRHPGNRSGHRRAPVESPRRNRNLSAGSARRTPSARAALQEACDIEDGRPLVQHGGRAALARSHA
jgi:hypothetical protein